MDDYYYDYDDHNYDAYHDDLLEEDFAHHHHTFAETWSACVLPSLVQIITYIRTFLQWNILHGFANQFAPKHSKFQHTMSILCGTCSIYFTLGAGVVQFFIFTGLILLAFQFACLFRLSRLGYILTATSMLALILGELLERDAKLWHQLRGTHMIVVMKFISLGFDLDAGKISQDNSIAPIAPNIVETLGYIMCPANCVIGPWVSFTDYMASYQPSALKWRPKWFLWIAMNLTASVFFLICSNCLISSIIPADSWKWLTAYRDAMSFRFSSYFISFLSQALMVTNGFASGSTATASKWYGYIITKPVTIEWPRSMVHVVVVWNISMHVWLKTYVFRIMKPHGTFTAIFVTYIVSALLHGLNFQLAAVLLSLGVYTYVEYKLRQKLAAVFSACILASPCPAKCVHEHKWQRPNVLLFNGVFGVLTVLHLAYLGVMFEASTHVQEQGFSIEHALGKWRSLDFLSHWIVAGSYLFYKLI